MAQTIRRNAKPVRRQARGQQIDQGEHVARLPVHRRFGQRAVPLCAAEQRGSEPELPLHFQHVPDHEQPRRFVDSQIGRHGRQPSILLR